MIQRTRISEFWNWFQDIAASLAADIQNGMLLEELDKRMHDLDSSLAWEVGPEANEPLQLVISPNLDPNLRARAQEIVSQAPVIPGWEFHSARRPKEWD